MDSLYNHLFEDVHREVKPSESRDSEHGEIAIGFVPGQSYYAGEPMGWAQPVEERDVPGVMAHVETHITGGRPPSQEIPLSRARPRSKSRPRLKTGLSDDTLPETRPQDMPFAHLRGPQGERIQFY